MKLKLLGTVLVLFLVGGCATLQTNQQALDTRQLDNINANTLNIFLIGDAGFPNKDGSPPHALGAMQEQFRQAGPEDWLLFLGDNVYPKGISETHTQADIRALQMQLDVAKTFPGEVLFIPGNHDWYSGVEGLKRQEKLVEEALGKNTFQPENGCPIEKIEINDEVLLLVVDSHWYITNWDRHPIINDACEFRTRHDFLEEFRSEIKKARGKTTLVAIHHPVFTNGTHGANYSFSDHMKPIPGLGTLKNILRSTSGIVNADIYNQFYNDLRQNLVAAAQQNDRVIFLSGHDHSLQYIQTEGLAQVISGSGAKTTAVKVKNKSDYGEGANGYAVLNVYNDKTTNVQFVNTQRNQIAFKKTIHTKEDTTTVSYPRESFKHVTAAIYTKEETSKSKMGKWLWGKRFRDSYSTPVKANVVYLDTLYGGLEPFRKGGGTQSKTLHLKAKDGRRYVMRAMRKQAAQFVQAALLKDQYVEDDFKNTQSEALLEDLFTGSHPYAAFTIATLAEAIALPHLNPKLYYIPKQEALGRFNTDFGNELYMLEEHPSDGHLELGSDGFTGDIISTFDMMQEVQSDEDVVINETAFVKARLFDMLIGDADRHQDQWRWMAYEENGKTIYHPLPRDRDLAFSRMSDGALPSLAVALFPPARKFRAYQPDLKDVKGFNISGFPLDVAFTSMSDPAVWEAQAQFIQERMTDEVIDKAFEYFPEALDVQIKNDIIKTLKQRRKNLQKIAGRYQKLLHKHAVLKATDKDDYIKIEAGEHGAVTVSMLRKKGDAYKDQFYYKTFTPSLTKEIWIYGLDDDDTFEVFGTLKKIKVRLIGGQNNDEFIVENGRNVIIYDYKTKKNTFNRAQKATIKQTDAYDINVYNYRKLRNNENLLLPKLGYNPDDGVRLGMSSTYKTYGFEQNPFTGKHQFQADYFFATRGYDLKYRGEFAHVVGRLNLVANVVFHSPNFSLNFFGYGNETKNHDGAFGMNYNRVKVREFSVAPALRWDSKRGSSVEAGVSYQSIEVHNTKNRFVNAFNVLPDYLFDEVNFGGVYAKFNYTNTDSKAYPTMGLNFNLNLGYTRNLDVGNSDFVYVVPSVNVVHKLDYEGRLVLASLVKSHLNFGDGFEFYQAAAIGGSDGPRGFRNQRFTGQQALYQNTDLRYSFNRFKTQLIPLHVGVYGSFDYGRVWIENDTSKKWHTSFGGGLFINAVDVLSANVGLFNSDDGTRLTVGLGFGF
ncbi:MAG: phosphoesterase [Algicola sp.]|nr:phosphoesterase [Algicola sp.]